MCARNDYQKSYSKFSEEIVLKSYFILSEHINFLAKTTPLNSAFHAFWLVNLELIGKVLFTSKQLKRNEMASRFASVSEEEIITINEEAVPKSTKMATNNNLIFWGGKSKHNALFTKTVEHKNYNVNNETQGSYASWKPLNFRGPILRPWKILEIGFLVFKNPWLFAEKDLKMLTLVNALGFWITSADVLANSVQMSSDTNERVNIVFFFFFHPSPVSLPSRS